jgi:hypothetical protein
MYFAIQSNASVKAAVLALAVLTWGAISGGLRQIPRSNTPGRQVETGVQLACGVLSLLAVVTCFRLRRWAFPVRAAWAISLALTVGLSSVVWGPPLPIVGLVFAAGAFLVALVVICALRVAVNGPEGR